MLQTLLAKVIGTQNERELKRLQPLVEEINAFEPTISSLIASAEGGDPLAADALFAALYSELHRLARRQLARNARDMTLGTTTLLHEAYLDMAQRESVFPDRGRFMAYAARVMRKHLHGEMAALTPSDFIAQTFAR